MNTVPQNQSLVAFEHAAVTRIRAIAQEEGERRFRAVAQDAGLPLGEYDGKSCATTNGVAEVFGVTPRAIRWLLNELNGDLPGASETVPAVLVRKDCGAGKLNFPAQADKVTLIFWPGFLACALRGRTEVARSIAVDLVRAEDAGRVAQAAGTVLKEEYDRVVAALDAAGGRPLQLARDWRALRETHRLLREYRLGAGKDVPGRERVRRIHEIIGLPEPEFEEREEPPRRLAVGAGAEAADGPEALQALLVSAVRRLMSGASVPGVMVVKDGLCELVHANWRRMQPLRMGTPFAYATDRALSTVAMAVPGHLGGARFYWNGDRVRVTRFVLDELLKGGAA
jgi:hypothetical protein